MVDIGRDDASDGRPMLGEFPYRAAWKDAEKRYLAARQAAVDELDHASDVFAAAVEAAISAVASFQERLWLMSAAHVALVQAAEMVGESVEDPRVSLAGAKDPCWAFAQVAPDRHLTPGRVLDVVAEAVVRNSDDRFSNSARFGSAVPGPRRKLRKPRTRGKR